MANHPIPDNNPQYMYQQYGTKYLITDPRSETLLRRAQMNSLKQKKAIVDAWTI